MKEFRQIWISKNRIKHHDKIWRVWWKQTRNQGNIIQVGSMSNMKLDKEQQQWKSQTRKSNNVVTSIRLKL